MAHHQGMILLSLAHLLLARPMQRRFESDPLFKATLLLLQERIPKAAALYLAPRRAFRDSRRFPAVRRRRCACSAAPTRRYRKCSCCRTADTTSWSPTRAAAAAAGRTSPSPAGAKTAPATTGARSATSATWRAGSSGRPRISRRCKRAGALRGDLHRGARRVPPARQRLRIAHRDRRFAGRRHRAAPAAHHQPLADAADDRRHELRGSRPRAACRGRAASGVLQSLRADRDHRAAAGHPVHAPAPLARRAAALDVPPDGRPRAGFAGRFLRDRPHGVHRPRTHGRRSAGDDRCRKAVRQPGLGAGSDRRDPASDDARSAADGDDRHRVRHRPKRATPRWASSGNTRTGIWRTASSIWRGRTAG